MKMHFVQRSALTDPMRTDSSSYTGLQVRSNQYRIAQNSVVIVPVVFNSHGHGQGHSTEIILFFDIHYSI